MLRPIDLKFFLSLLREHLEISHRRLGMDSARRARLAVLIVTLPHREVEIVCRSNELMRPNRGGLLNNLAGSCEHKWDSHPAQCVRESERHFEITLGMTPAISPH